MTPIHLPFPSKNSLWKAYRQNIIKSGTVGIGKFVQDDDNYVILYRVLDDMVLMPCVL